MAFPLENALRSGHSHKCLSDFGPSVNRKNLRELSAISWRRENDGGRQFLSSGPSTRRMRCLNQIVQSLMNSDRPKDGRVRGRG